LGTLGEGATDVGDGGGAAAGLPCWRHATPEETTRIAGIYDAAVRDHDCPGCDATAGRPCYTGPDDAAHLRLVDGEWSRTRSFKAAKSTANAWPPQSTTASTRFEDDTPPPPSPRRTFLPCDAAP